MSVKHAFVSAKSDGADSSLVRPSDWNADHVVEFVGVSVYKSGNQSILNDASTAVTFDTELVDTHGFHASGDSAPLTVPSGLAGWYQVIGTIRYASGGGSGERFAQLFLTSVAGTVLKQTNVPPTSAQVTIEVTVVVWLDEGDVVVLGAYQTGGTLNAEGGGRHRTSLSMHYLGA